MQFEARQFHGNFFREYDQKKEIDFKEEKLGFVKKVPFRFGTLYVNLKYTLKFRKFHKENIQNL